MSIHLDGADQPVTDPAEPPSVTAELAAMRKLVNALEALDEGARRRVLVWLADRYSISGEG